MPAAKQVTSYTTRGLLVQEIGCCLFHGCLTAGEVLLAREVVQHMQAVGLKPSAYSFTALLSATANLDASRQHSAAVACLLRQLAVGFADDEEGAAMGGVGGGEGGQGGEQEQEQQKRVAAEMSVEEMDAQALEEYV